MFLKIIKFAFSLLLIPLLIPIALFLILNEFIRFLVSFFLLPSGTILNPDGYDSLFTYKTSTGHRTVLYVAVLDNNYFNIKQHIKNYKKYVFSKSEYAKLKQIFVPKYFYNCLQSDPNFDVRNHVRLYEKEGVSEKELFEKVLPKLCHDFGEERPQWEDVIVRKFNYEGDNKDYTLRILRIHHGYMDGVSNLLMLADTQGRGGLDKFPWVIHPLNSGSGSVWVEKLGSLLYLPFVAVNHFFNGFKKSAWVHPTEMTGKTLHGWTEPISMDLLNFIKLKSGCSMPAVLTSVLVKGITRLKKEFGKKLGDDLVIGMVTALLPYKSLHLRNNHSILPCNFITTTEPESSRRSRLLEINNTFKRASSSPEIFLNYLLPSLYGRLPSFISDQCSSLITGDGVVSNFPASRNKIQLWNNEVVEMGGWVPLVLETGFACVTLRYDNKLRFCLNADEACFSKQEFDYFLTTLKQEVHFLGEEFRRGSSIIGRFLVTKVDEEENINNNSNSFNNTNNCLSREERFQRVVEKLTKSFEKIKNE